MDKATSSADEVATWDLFPAQRNAQMTPPPRPDRPYVGGRRFKRAEQALLFGRDRQARILCDKIFSARLTLLYSPSGVGKSSVLCALVIPELEAEQAHVIYQEAWTDEDPLAPVKAQLITIARICGIPDPGAGSPTLEELVALVDSADDRTVVIIFDQVEELLRAHAHRLDLLRRELGPLVRPGGPDVRVLLSLDEESLAALEPLRPDMLELFQSTYRLEALGREDVELAVAHAARLFGVDWEPGLIERVVHDLEKAPGTPGKATDLAAGEVELPMLQLVCERLWEAKGEATTISATFYERLGEAEGILEAYVRSVMPATHQEQRFTAILMRSLAPPSGFKASFTAGDLAAITRLPQARVAAELERLCRHRVLRAREFRSGTRYELLHDFFSALVGPWRDAVLERERRQRAARRWSLAALLIIPLAMVAGWRGNLYARTDQRFAELRRSKSSLEPKAFPSLAERTFDEVTGYLLNQDGSSSRAHLQRLLRDNKDLLPSDYGVDRVGSDLIALDDRGSDAPLTLRYSASRNLDGERFTAVWRSWATSVTRARGFPVPLQLRLVREETFPLRHLEIIGPGLEPLQFDLAADEGSFVIDTAELSSRQASLLETLAGVREIEHLPSYRAVPRWSLPIWKNSGRLAMDGSGLLARQLSSRLQDTPGRLLGAASFERLLKRAAEQHGRTVDEARAARGERLRDDLIELLRRRGSLERVESLLDAVAAYPRLRSDEVASRVMEGPPSPESFPGPWTTPVASDDLRGTGMREAGLWLPEVQPPIRCRIGLALAPAWLDGRGPRQDLLERALRVRDEVRGRYGVDVPEPVFSVDPELRGADVRFEIHGQPVRDDGDWVAIADARTALDRFEFEFRRHAVAHREQWVSAESVHGWLSELDPWLKDWIFRKYSTTGIKILLRMVVRADTGEGALRGQAPREKTASHLPWLLGSLVFWSQMEPAKPARLADALRKTQRARFAGAAAINGPVDGTVLAAVQALGRGDVAKAEAAFRDAIASSRGDAEQAFLHRYAEHFQDKLRQDLATACGKSPVRLSADQRLFIAERLGSGEPLPGEEAKRLRLCRYVGTPEGMRRARLEQASDLLHRHPDRTSWSPEDAVTFGLEVLEDLDSVQGDQGLGDKASELVLGGFPGLRDAGAAETTFRSLLDRCSRPGPRRTCRELLQKMANAWPESEIQLYWAQWNSEAEVVSSLDEALRFANKAEQKLVAASPEAREERRRLIDLVRASAQVRLSELGAERYWEEAERRARGSLEDPVLGRVAHRVLVKALSQGGRVDKAREVLAEALRRWPEDPDLLMLRLLDDLQVNPEAAAKFSASLHNRVSRESGKERGVRLYMAALGQLLTMSDKWELSARQFIHERYPEDRADLAHKQLSVLLMLYTRLAGESQQQARRILEDSWARTERATWRARLHDGDKRVWDEMLVGYYMGEVTRDDLLRPLHDDASFESSGLMSLGRPRGGLLCEAHFYDALLAQSQGDIERMKKALLATMATRYLGCPERIMAKYLSARAGGDPDKGR